MHIHQFTFFNLLFFSLMLSATTGYAADSDYRSPEHVAGTATATAAEVKALHDNGAIFIDVRNQRLYDRLRIPGAYHLDLKYGYDEESLAAVANKDEPVIIYCSGVKCSRSYRASEMAVSWGYKKVYYFRGGIVDWRDAGYPVESSSQKSTGTD